MAMTGDSAPIHAYTITYATSPNKNIWTLHKFLKLGYTVAD